MVLSSHEDRHSIARCEREATASVIAHLAELDARRLYLGAGFSSLFTYCCDVLHLSEPAAYNRIEAARAARRFPAIRRRSWWRQPRTRRCRRPRTRQRWLPCLACLWPVHV